MLWPRFINELLEEVVEPIRGYRLTKPIDDSFVVFNSDDRLFIIDTEIFDNLWELWMRLLN